MSPVMIPDPVTITKSEASNFVMTIIVALSRLSQNDLQQVYLFNAQENSIIISYSADYQPFIGFTQGYNPHNHRCYIGEDASYVFQCIADALEARNRSIAGGRVFISKDCVYIKNDDFRRDVFLCFCWEGEEDHFMMIGAAYNFLLGKERQEVLKLLKENGWLA